MNKKDRILQIIAYQKAEGGSFWVRAAQDVNWEFPNEKDVTPEGLRSWYRRQSNDSEKIEMSRILDKGRHLRDIEDIVDEARWVWDSVREREQLRNHGRSISFSGGPVCIVFSGDEHIGSRGCDIDRIFSDIEDINKIPNCYHFRMGDIADNFTVGRLIKQNYKSYMPIEDQWRVAKEVVKATGDRLIAWVSGNHDQWTTEDSGVDIHKEIVPESCFYSPDEIYLTVNVGLRSFLIRARHSWPGTSAGNPTHGMEKSIRDSDSRPDIVVGAHTHQFAAYREFVVHQRRRVAILTGSYKGVDDYQVQKGFVIGDGSTIVGLVLKDDGTFFGTSHIDIIREYMTNEYRSEYGEDRDILSTEGPFQVADMD